MRLHAKFTLVMLGVLGLAVACAWMGSLWLERRSQQRQAIAEAQMMIGAAGATMHYTAAQVRPLLADRMREQFLPQGVPFFAARQTVEELAKGFPGYTFRQAALNPTNPGDRATEAEAEIIRAFQADPTLRSLVRERPEGGDTLLTYAQPIRITDAACLVCHSTPDKAPPAMVDVYGRENGFGWEMNQVVAATMVTVPRDGAVERAGDEAAATGTVRVAPAAWSERWLVLAGMVAIAVGIIVLLNIMLYAVVIRPIRRMSRLADEVSLGNMEAPEFGTGSRDEIGSLGRSFSRMRNSLGTALGMLEG